MVKLLQGKPDPNANRVLLYGTAWTVACAGIGIWRDWEAVQTLLLFFGGGAAAVLIEIWWNP